MRDGNVLAVPRLSDYSSKLAMELLPIVIGAEYRGEYLIMLTFNDGVEQTLDFAQWLEGPVFEPLKDIGYFQRFFLDGGNGCVAQRR